jgi:hypothetical protein
MLSSLVFAQQRTAEPLPASHTFIPTQKPSWVSHGEPLKAKMGFPQAHTPVQSPQGVPKPKYKTSGREFYVAFLSTVGNDQPGNTSPKEIFVVCRSHTKGTIMLANGSWSQSFECLPKVPTPIRLPDWAVLDRNEIEQKYPRLFKVMTDDDVAVYAVSFNLLSSDGYLALPKEALGTNYVVSSLRNALWYYSGAISPWNLSINVPRSEFAVGATEDNTDVTIQLSADSWSGKYLKGNLYTFTLDKGQIIQFMARDTGVKGMVDYWDSPSQSYIPKVSWVGKGDDFDCDLTGSIVSSTKPVAVFSGHERASVPDSLEFAWAGHPVVSRDHLIEQMPPVELWGQDFIAIGSMQDDRNSRPKGGDLLRVISRYDNTVVYLNGKFLDTLAQGAYTQFYSGDLAHIETSQPALVIKYMQTCSNDDKDSLYLGDPDMTVVPPVENMSTFYSIPTIAQGGNFEQHFISILIDSAAISQTILNTVLIDPATLKPVPNTRFYYGRYRTYAGEQRLESPLPCYAETYGYGNHDSYTLSGGGDFKYIRDLAAKDLDFGTVFIGGQKDSTTAVFVDVPPSPLADTLEVFHYSWDYGDTNAFVILDTVTAPIRIAPGGSIPVRIKFFPPQKLGSYKARIRVWSSNYRDVFINLTGNVSTKRLEVYPVDLYFPPYRVSKTDTLPFQFFSTGESAVRLTETSWDKYLRSGAFASPVYAEANPIASGDSTQHAIYFTPPSRNYFNDTISFINDGDPPYTPILRVHGRGIMSKDSTVNHDFKEVQFGYSSKWDTDNTTWAYIPITNTGDDSTHVLSIKLVGGDSADFDIDPASVGRLPILLDTLGAEFDPVRFSPRNVFNYRARFIPHYKPAFDPDGRRFALVEIKTDYEVHIDTLFGRGVEPWFTSDSDTLDFGVIINPPYGSPALLTQRYHLYNFGTSIGLVDTLINYLSQFPVENRETYRGQGILADSGKTNAFVDVDFLIDKVGEYFDSITNGNTSRVTPIVFLKGVIRASLKYIPLFEFGDIASCTPIDTTLTFTNITRVPIPIDSIFFSGEYGGFEITSPKPLILPVIVAPNTTFDLHVRYTFPLDSLNGSQTALLIFKQPLGGEAIGFRYDTVRFTLTRKSDLLTLATQQPPYKPNALDQPFRMPIYLKGQRLGKTQLNDISVKLYFPNELIAPVGIDRSNSLSESTPSNGIPQQPSPVWDPVTRMYTIPCTGLKLSSDASKNNLLVTVLCKAYLTQDTVATIVQELGFDAEAPCAFRVARDSITIEYADECGDKSIRSVMTGGAISIIVSAPDPNPALAGNEVRVPYFTKKDALLGWSLYDARGTLVASESERKIYAGSGTIVIPSDAIKVSGTYFLKITGHSNLGEAGETVTKFNVTH